MLTHIQSLFLDYLRHWTLGTSWGLLAPRGVASFLLVEGLVGVWGPILFLDDEIWRPFKVALSVFWPTLVLQCVWVFTNVSQYLLPVFSLPMPLRYIVVWLFLLKSLQDHLIFCSYFHKLPLTSLSVERLPWHKLLHGGSSLTWLWLHWGSLLWSIH